jgi:hypothetical protein
VALGRAEPRPAIYSESVPDWGVYPKTVLEATAESREQAEKEWQHAAHSREMRALSAAPAINLKPVSGGVEIAVRYITRASERYRLRARLYQAAMNLISKKEAQEPISISEKEGVQPAR